MTTLIVSLRTGGTYELCPEDGERIRWYVEDNGTLMIKCGKFDKETELWSDWSIFRAFAHGHWADIEVVE